MQNKISVTILTKNSSKYLRECFSSVSEFDEIVVLDNGSSDDTIEIAKSFANVKVYESPFIGFGPLKNLAASYASNDWVFSLDSDEVVSEELKKSILNLELENQKIYEFERLNHYDSQIVTCCGWSPDKVLRIYNRQVTSYNDAKVHESIMKRNLQVSKIGGKLIHYSFDSIEALLDKLQRYSTLWAEQNKFKKNSSLAKATLRSIFAFFKNFILQKGIIGGKNGFLISVCNALGVFFKYAKLAELNKKLTVSLIITTYNRPDALELVLLSAFSQTVLPDEIIIADDGSGEETRKLIDKMRNISPVPLLHAWQEDDGFRAAASRNNALRLAKSEYIVLVDGDMILDKNFIKDHKKFAKYNQFIQGSRVLLNRFKTEKTILEKTIDFGFFSQRISNRMNALHCPILIKPRDNLKGIRTCNMAFWLEDAKKINGFNEEFVGWGREDSEFAVRLLNAVIKRKNLKFGAIQYHLWHHESTRENLPENDLILDSAIKDKKTWCEKGIYV